MHNQNRILGIWQAAAVATSLLIAGATGAETRDSAAGYVGDIEGSVLRTGTGECVRSGDWTPDKATVVGCDDVTLDAPVEIVVGQPTGIVEGFVIPAASLFAFDSAEVTPEGKNALEEYRAQFAPAITDAAAAVIIGHTDSTGDEKYNHELSLRRAEAVHDYLVATGTPAEKLRFIGRGENDPIAPNDTPEGQALNRRVEVIVVAELRGFDAMRFPSVALFPRRSAELTPEGKKVLEKHRNDAREMLQRAVYVEVLGHTDDVGDDAYNQDLSEQRANTVRDYLIATGADGSKMLAVGAGERMPIASNNTPEGRAENRRVEVLVLGRLKSQ
jgi:OOP family OmpA-OmpF porin